MSDNFLKHPALRIRKILSSTWDFWGRQKAWVGQLRSRPAITEIQTRLDELAESLKTICNDVEPVFLQIGRELVSVNSDAEELMRQTLQAVGLVDGESDQGVLAKVGGLARDSIEELKRCEIEVPDNLNHVKAIVACLDNLEGMCGTIRRIAMMFRTIGLNVGVESSRSAESVVLFAVVANQLRQLSGKIVAITENIQDKLVKTRSSQVASCGKISEGLRHLKNLASESEETLQNARSEIEHLIRLSVEALELANAHSKEIFRQIGQVVVGVQFHDSMSQRIGHIAETLYDAQRLCREKLFEARNQNSGQEVFGTIYSMLQLQTAQLKQLVSDVDAVHTTNIQAFEKIGRQIAELIQSLSMLGSGDRMLSSALSDSLIGAVHERKPQGYALKKEKEDPFITLHAALRHLNMLVGQGRKMAKDLDDGADEASEAAAMISDCIEDVRTIGSESHLIALNAIVQAAHLDDQGLTLEVLAQEIKRISDQMAEFVKNILKLLDAITSSAGKLKARFPVETQETGTADGEDMSLDVSIQEILRTYEQFNAYSSDASQRAEALQTAISQAKAELVFLPALAQKIAAKQTQLEKIVESLSPWVGDNAKLAQGKIEKIHNRYTMQQERTIHEQYLEQPGQPAPACANDSDAESDSEEDESVSTVFKPTRDVDTDQEDFGENVELF